MNISITFHMPLKARLVKHSNSSEEAFYLGIRRWLFAYGVNGSRLMGRVRKEGNNDGFVFWA